ncbi:MAG: hypothetical protein GTO22_17150 [Gemmatimonadales bacterium]|nr:hypothetical protein [Gemmatimonadales bacterium]
MSAVISVLVLVGLFALFGLTWRGDNSSSPCYGCPDAADPAACDECPLSEVRHGDGTHLRLER